MMALAELILAHRGRERRQPGIIVTIRLVGSESKAARRLTRALA
jgi:hypothetical protein